MSVPRSNLHMRTVLSGAPFESDGLAAWAGERGLDEIGFADLVVPPPPMSDLGHVAPEYVAYGLQTLTQLRKRMVRVGGPRIVVGCAMYLSSDPTTMAEMPWDALNDCEHVIVRGLGESERGGLDWAGSLRFLKRLRVPASLSHMDPSHHLGTADREEVLYMVEEEGLDLSIELTGAPFATQGAAPWWEGAEARTFLDAFCKRPGSLTIGTPVDVSKKAVADIDRQYAFIEENGWQDAVRRFD